jgi:hypothetical protein
MRLASSPDRSSSATFSRTSRRDRHRKHRDFLDGVFQSDAVGQVKEVHLGPFFTGVQILPILNVGFVHRSPCDIRAALCVTGRSPVTMQLSTPAKPALIGGKTIEQAVAAGAAEVRLAAAAIGPARWM